MTPFSLRSARISDLTAIADLDKEFPTSGSRIAEELDVARFRLLLQNWRKLRMLQVVAESEGQVVGYGLISPRLTAAGPDMVGRSAVLSNLAVRKENRRIGVGRAIALDLERRARGIGIDVLYAHVPPTALEFYDSLGWTAFPHSDGFAWIESATYEQWEQMRSYAPEEAGNRRRAALLRADYPDIDSGFGHMATKILNDSGVTAAFNFNGSTKNSMMDAGTLLAHRCSTDEALWKSLPEDIARMIGDIFLPTMIGARQAASMVAARTD